jgi:hypothetical protein
MRTACCLLSASALLFGALAIGNPMLPKRGVGSSSSPLANDGLKPRRPAASLLPKNLWQTRVFAHQSPAFARDLRSRIVLPGDVGHVPFAQPATFQPAGAVGATAPLVQPAIDWQRPQ